MAAVRRHGLVSSNTLIGQNGSNDIYKRDIVLMGEVNVKYPEKTGILRFYPQDIVGEFIFGAPGQSNSGIDSTSTMHYNVVNLLCNAR
jgi:hypothetical protein